MKNMMKKTLLVILISILGTSSAFAATVCTPFLKVEKLMSRGGGWTHPVLEGLENADIKECGKNTKSALLLNFNNTTGNPNPNGQKMLLRQLELAFAMQLDVQICSVGCDSQHSQFSSVSYVNVRSKDKQ
jgi:hypothetical protein